MKTHTPCDTVLVGKSEYCDVTHCKECKSYHLHIGFMSLHLNEEVFETICEVLIGIYKNKNIQSNYISQGIHHH